MPSFYSMLHVQNFFCCRFLFKHCFSCSLASLLIYYFYWGFMLILWGDGCDCEFFSDENTVLMSLYFGQWSLNDNGVLQYIGFQLGNCIVQWIISLLIMVLEFENHGYLSIFCFTGSNQCTSLHISGAHIICDVI